MTSLFYKHYWCIVKEDVINFVQDFFRDGHLLKEINNPFISLLPPKKN